MTKSAVVVASVVVMLFCATDAFAQGGALMNPLGLDAGPFHPPITPQVTNYIPPETVAVAPAAPPHRKHRPSRN